MNLKTKISPEIVSGHKAEKSIAHFCERVFDRKAEEKYLPSDVVCHLEQVREGKVRFDLNLADSVAEGMKLWALHHGATHFCHWFQPLTHLSAEKHDAFFSKDAKGTFSQAFTGKELMSGEPDASSFPSGGLRATHEARGYTAWDPLSFPFLWESREGLTLCIPALFYSWKGVSLDHKIPLHRSNQKISAAAMRLLDLCKVDAKSVAVTLGVEQEYFLIDDELFAMRPDLVLTGRTLFGAKPAKGQELEDHYCGAVQPHVLECMRDFEQTALRLGIPVKTRHNEVAPCQHEVAPLFETASLASDHNLLLMEIMRQSAERHGLACLLHEKPFAGLNGSGKHNNWSLASDTGVNLLDPKGPHLVFLATLAAVVRGVHEHAGLLRASIGSASNDHRLGGSEAPPSILSIFLGESLESLVQDIIHDRPPQFLTQANLDLGLSHMPLHLADATDRNRTSFFVFTGNKFEFRAVGASASCAFPVAVLNAIVADALELIVSELTAVFEKSSAATVEAALPVLKKHFQAALPVIFGGNNYSSEWHKEAEERGLPNFSSSFKAFHLLKEKKSIRVLEDVLSEKEIESRFEILVEQYAKKNGIEMRLMLELFATQIVPSVQRDIRQRLELLHMRKSAPQQKVVDLMGQLLDKALGLADEIRMLDEQSNAFGWESKAKVFAELILPKMQELRGAVDALELQTDHDLWPMVKIRELLF